MDSIYWWEFEIGLRENHVDHGGLDDVPCLRPGRTCIAFIDSVMTNVGRLFVLCCFAKYKSEVWVHEHKLGARGSWPWCRVSSVFLYFVGFVLHNLIWRKWENCPSWWKSLNLSKSSNYLSLTLWSSAFQLFHVAYVLIKFANSPRPDLWVLERSVDNGRTFMPWQYFAREFIMLST